MSRLPALAPALLALVLTAAAPAASAGAADFPVVNHVDGVIRVVGTAGDDVFALEEGSTETVWIRANHGFETVSPSDGVCHALTEVARCDLPGPAPAPADVAFDLGAGADSVTRDAAAVGVRRVTAGYELADAGLAYTGGTPATVTIGGVVDTLDGVDRVVGTPFADTFDGGPAAESFVGGDGDDTFRVGGAGGPADAVDCGPGRDVVTLRAGLDTQTGCEVVNGVDLTAPVVTPPPPPLVLPTPAAPPPVTFLPPPTFKAPPKVSGATIDVTVTCAPGGCPGTTLALAPPPVGAGGLPQSWPNPTGPAKLDELLAVLSASGLGTLQRELALALRQEEQRRRELELAGQAGKIKQDAELQQLAAIQQLIMAMVQASVIMAGTPPSGTLKTQIGKLPASTTTPLGGVKGPAVVKPPLVGDKPKPHHALAVAARARPTGKALRRWFLARTAAALPTVTTKLTPTATPNVYRARVKAPTWLRATSRILRRSGVRSLPVDLVVGGTKARVRLPLPR